MQACPDAGADNKRHEKMKYSIVIPTYNNFEKYLKPCIESIFKHSQMTDVELVISANGCTDETDWYLQSLRHKFDSLGFGDHLKVIWNNRPLGYPKATNEGIKAATAQKIVLLNNDTVLLEQAKNQWLELLEKPFHQNADCGITSVIKSHSDSANRDFAIFFCVMVDRKVFDTVGLLNEDYEIGGCEDIEFCIQAENAGFSIHEALQKQLAIDQYTGWFPIYHKGEGTMNDPDLVGNWQNVFAKNNLKLAKKYNPEWYKWKLSNDYERAVFLKGDPVFPREATRYEWAAKNIRGEKILEIGCSTGYGRQFFGNIDYTGIDYDPVIIEVAQDQGWDGWFVNADINKFRLETYDSIIAFEVIEHLDNGLELVERLKWHCKRLLITVPLNEHPGFWGHHHKLHGLNESHFPGFKFAYINEAGEISDKPQAIDENNRANLMLCRWDYA
jgi:glycosyltransferase involved in cell wall biosynthesis